MCSTTTKKQQETDQIQIRQDKLIVKQFIGQQSFVKWLAGVWGSKEVTLAGSDAAMGGTWGGPGEEGAGSS